MPSILEQISTLNSIKKDIAKGCSNNNGENYNFSGWQEYLSKINDTTTNKNSDKYGINIGVFLPQLDEYNSASHAASQKDIVFDENVLSIGNNALSYAWCQNNRIKSLSSHFLKNVKSSGLYHAFDCCTSLASVDLSSLQGVESAGLSGAFYNCTNLASIDLSSLQSVGSYGLSFAFYKCTSLTSVDLSSLQGVESEGLSFAFYNCSSITSVDLSSLQSVGSYGLRAAFGYCSSLTSVSFPALRDVMVDSFSGSVFSNCPALTEIHFRADMQSTIKAMTGYDTKLGATNATIYFDLVDSTATLTINTTPENATVNTSIDNQTWQTGNTGSFEIGSVVYYTVTMDGYKTINGSIAIEEDTVLDIALEPIMVTLKINPTPSDSTVTFQDDNGTVIDSQTSQEIDKYAWYDETTQTTYYVIGETPAVGDIVYDSEGNDTGKVVTTYSDGVISIG